MKKMPKRSPPSVEALRPRLLAHMRQTYEAKMPRTVDTDFKTLRQRRRAAAEQASPDGSLFGMEMKKANPIKVMEERGWLTKYIVVIDGLLYGRHKYWQAARTFAALPKKPIPRINFEHPIRELRITSG